MRTSLNNIKEAENFISEKLDPAESVLFNAKMVLDPLLRFNVAAQQKVYSLIRLYGRKKIKSEVEAVHAKIFSDPQNILLQKKIDQLFSKS